MNNDEAWDFALGLIKVDGLVPSDDFLEMIEKEKRGEMTMDEIGAALYEKYK